MKEKENNLGKLEMKLKELNQQIKENEVKERGLSQEI